MFRTTFYGQTISDYGRKYGRVDYRALASSFDAVLCNSILGYRDSWDEWEQISGFVDNSEAIEEKKAELEELEETIEEKTERKAELEAELEDIERANENIDELLSHFDDFEYEANELDERVRWYDFELPSGEDLDTDAIRRAIDCLDLPEMRYNIESHQEAVEDAKDETAEELEELEVELEELNKQKERLEAEIEELEEEDSTETEYYQYYIISDGGYQILSENTNESVWYNEELDLYVWGVTHWGTSWDYVLTDIPCETYEETEARERAEAEAEAERKAKSEAMTDEERTEESAEELEELLYLWDTDEEEAYTIACIEEDERHSGCSLSDLVIETLDKIAEENRTKGETAEEDSDTLDSDTLDTIENMGGFVECVEEPNKDVQLLRTWQTIAKIERAIDEETKRIRAEEGDSYANECFRMMRHNFEVGDLVAHEDGGFPWTVTDTDRLGEVLVVEQDGDHTTLIDRFDVFGISSKGEEVRTPCTLAELELLKVNKVWC